MVAGAAVAPRVVDQFVVGLELRARQAFFPDERLERGCAEIRRANRNAPMIARRPVSSDR